MEITVAALCNSDHLKVLHPCQAFLQFLDQNSKGGLTQSSNSGGPGEGFKQDLLAALDWDYISSVRITWTPETRLT